MSDAAPSDLTTLHVRAAIGGDTQGLTRLVERFTPLLLAQARYRLRGRAAQFSEPEDLVQETWAITLPRLGDLQARDGRLTPVLVKFLATTLLRCATQVVRKHVLRADPIPRPAEAEPLAQLPAETSGVVTRLCRRNETDALREAIADLPADEREVLILRGIEQHANGEVARMLGIDDSAVTRRYQRALATLRHRLPDGIFHELE